MTEIRFADELPVSGTAYFQHRILCHIVNCGFIHDEDTFWAVCSCGWSQEVSTFGLQPGSGTGREWVLARFREHRPSWEAQERD